MLFDPRRYRAPFQGPKSHGEYVTATHLYAYFQEVDLSEKLIPDREQQMQFQSPWITPDYMELNKNIVKVNIVLVAMESYNK